ncbi:MAG: ChaN family lipoprotein [Desulfobacteraceae bacterium]|nr:ChaN family lipoprotein [Desulfobacteraceae bacterium]MBC2757032.1 ChaN family lipoprotein [Desulfobacteraceae bacterium]
MSESFPENTIISSERKSPISFDTLMKDLETMRIVFVGEHHNNPAHHDFQLKILTALYEKNPQLTVGMEIFDQTYQPILDQWSAGALDRQAFIEKVHWYANWKFDFELYGKLLDFIKNNQIPIVALNIPSRVTARIAVGGIDNLFPSDSQFLPQSIDLSNSDHRTYIEKIFSHHNIKGRDNFEYFYSAQCVWEDVMAESISKHIDNSVMLVFTGNGHLVRKFGIPDRVFKRAKLPYRTILPYPAGRQTELKDADYIWVSPLSGRSSVPAAD